MDRNRARICVSVCGRTAGEFLERLKLAENSAPDLIELRFDCLGQDEFEQVEIAFNEKYIAVFRPKDQGGAREINIEDRRDFWNSVPDFCGADLEEDIIRNVVFRGFKPVICSYHDFSGTPTDLPEIFDRLTSTGADVVKIAVAAADITDTIEVWRLLTYARQQGKAVIPIVMGEAGKWTRILGPAYGSYLTYASLEEGAETAPGQITLDDLRDVYRVGQLDTNTAVYGIVGGSTTHSLSPYLHNAAFGRASLNSVFVPLQVNDLGGFISRMVKPPTREIGVNFKGFAVTIPHKQAIIGHLDEIDETARIIGAVNTVKIEGGKLYGFNTDADGFIGPLKMKFGDLANARAAVIGAGGAARACVYALRNVGADVTVFARDLSKARNLAAELDSEATELTGDAAFGAFDIVVNATPLGMTGKAEGETPATAKQLAGAKLAYDLVYVPQITPFLNEAEEAGLETLGGLEMLIAQAERQFRIWTGFDPPEGVMLESAQTRTSRAEYRTIR